MLVAIEKVYLIKWPMWSVMSINVLIQVFYHYEYRIWHWMCTSSILLQSHGAEISKSWWRWTVYFGEFVYLEKGFALKNLQHCEIQCTHWLLRKPALLLPSVPCFLFIKNNSRLPLFYDKSCTWTAHCEVNTSEAQKQVLQRKCRILS